jgi:hypothetical protein
LLFKTLLSTASPAVEPVIRNAVGTDSTTAAGALRAADGDARSHDVCVAEHSAQLANRSHLSVIFNILFDGILLIGPLPGFLNSEPRLTASTRPR